MHFPCNKLNIYISNILLKVMLYALLVNYRLAIRILLLTVLKC